jgi:hypothetical protein
MSESHEMIERINKRKEKRIILLVNNKVESRKSQVEKAT